MTTGALQVSPSVDRLAITSTMPPPDWWPPSQEVSHTPWRASKAIDGSLTEKNGPVGVDAVVVAGRKPCVHEPPPSRLVAQPMSLEPPLNTRPVWNTATTVDPNTKVSGSTSVACAAVGRLSGANGSELICVILVCACSAPRHSCRTPFARRYRCTGMASVVYHR